MSYAGMRTPLLISRPGHVVDHGAVRTQYVEVIDLAPTIIEWVDACSGRPRESAGHGPSYDGASFATLLTDATSKTRSTQYFELRSNRAIVHDDWKAAAVHVPGTDFTDDNWMLFDLANDFSEVHDVAGDHPRRLEALKALCRRNRRPSRRP